MADPTYTLLVAGYEDPTSAHGDFAALRELERGGAITIVAAVVASRDEDGTVHVDERGDHSTVAGTGVGAVAGLLVGIIFPPAWFASTVVGGGIGAAIGKLRQRHHKNELEEAVEESLKPGTSGVVAVFENRFLSAVENALAASTKVTTRDVDAATVDDVKAEAAKEETASS